MSLYRQYRPQFFSDVVGQEAIVTTLKNGLKEQKLAHAYLFCGSRGTGKTTLARLLAKAMNCDHLNHLEPCGKCTSCQEIALGKSLDVLEIDGASNRGIDDIRKINETVSYAPSAGKFKIYIIDEVHMLTKEAFNALLKTLEEPPPHVKFFFATTEPHKVLPTIISRCQRFDLNRIPLSATIDKLSQIAKDQGVSCKEEALRTIALLAEGSLRDAESLLEQVLGFGSSLTVEIVQHTLRLVPSSCFFELDEAIHSQNYPHAFTLASSLFTSGKDLNHFLSSLISHFRNHLHLQYRLPLTSLTEELARSYLKTASSYTEEQCLFILEYLIDWEQKIRHLTLSQTTLEMILVSLIRSKYKISLTALTKRLLALEESLKHNRTEEPPKAAEPAPVKEAIPASAADDKPFQGAYRTSSEPEKPVGGSSARHETLVRFAAVELEGVIKK